MKKHPETVAFIGLGVMGFPMAGHLANAGYQVCVFNRSLSKADKWLTQYSGLIAETPAKAAASADAVFICVGNDDDVREVMYGDKGILSTAQSDAVIVDHTTTSAELARELAQACETQSCHFIDAPVSGGQAGAENGKLTVMAGGNESSFNRIKPCLNTYAQRAALLGETGSGQLAKMVNQICIAGLLQGLSEALHFGQNAGLDMPAVIDVISKGAAQSWQMENRHQSMLKGEYNHGFAVDWMRKDLGFVLAEARRNNSQLPVTALVDQFYADVQQAGGGRWDTSSLLTRLIQSQSD